MAGIDDRLASLEERYAELERDLSDPDAFEDLDRVQRLSQEQARLREVVETGRRWREAHRRAGEAAEMAQHETEPELVSLAEEEEQAQRAVAEAAQDQLRT